MMTWLKVVSVLLTLAERIADHLQTEAIKQGGRNEAELANLRELSRRVARARRVTTVLRTPNANLDILRSSGN